MVILVNWLKFLAPMFFQNIGEACHFYNKNSCTVKYLVKMFKMGYRINFKNFKKDFFFCYIYLKYQRTISKKATV